MNKRLKAGFLFVVLALMASCNQPEIANDPLPIPSVSTVHPVRGNIQTMQQLNGQVVYLNKTTITAPISGYITEVNTAVGDRVQKGRVLFKIQTKESQALQSADASLPNQFGIIPVYASASGFINTLNVTDANVFVSEGSAMATIVKDTDLTIQVNAPFEIAGLLNSRKNIEIELPNGEILDAGYYKTIPYVDPVSQTQQILLKPQKHHILPENLNVLVTFFIQEKTERILLPKDAVLTNETQDQFWIMKVTPDSVAVKVFIKKGIENDGQIEILSPPLGTSDEIVVTGGYELPDSTKVRVK
jgi:multidrug efflux pump subunit AcrA (membrane-fusion protein)